MLRRMLDDGISWLRSEPDRCLSMSEGARPARRTANLGFALVLHFGLGLVWLLVIGTLAGGVASISLGESGAVPVGFLWALSAAVLWIVASVRMVRLRLEPGRVWATSLGWWCRTFVAPYFLVREWRDRAARAAGCRRSSRAGRRDSGARVERARAGSPESKARRVRPPHQGTRATGRGPPWCHPGGALRARGHAAAPPAPTTAPAAQPPPAPTPPAERPRIPARPAQPPRPPEPSWWSGPTVADLYSAKVLAWLGGAVMLLGIFFFVLAVNRGWIGRVARVSLGALASAVVFSAGLYLHRRFGPVYSAYAAVGVGIAGGYVTCSRRGSTTTSSPTGRRSSSQPRSPGSPSLPRWPGRRSWSPEFGLVGATVAPAAVGLQNGELSAAGTTFAAVMFAVTAVVAVRLNWQRLLIAGVAASLPQAAVLVAQSHATEWDVVAVAGVFWLLNLASALALQMRRRTADLGAFPASLVLLSASFAGASSVVLFTGNGEGWTLLVIAAVYGAAAAALFPRTRDRDLSALLAAAALALVAFGAADLLSGPALAIAWAAEAAVLSWLARRIQEFRYQLASLAYLAAALVQALALDAPPRQLYEASARPASGALALVGAALAGGIVAYYCRPCKAARRSAGILAPLEPSFALFRNSQPVWRSLTGWTATAVALYAASLGVLGLAQWRSSAGIESAFEWGQVAVAGLWGAVALAVLYAGLRRSWNEFRAAGFVVLCAALAQALLFFSTSLSGSPQALGFLVVAAALLAGSLLDRLWRADPTAFPAIIVYALSSLGLAVAAFVLLASGAIEGLALLALAGFYCLISASSTAATAILPRCCGRLPSASRASASARRSAGPGSCSPGLQQRSLWPRSPT